MISLRRALTVVALCGCLAITIAACGSSSSGGSGGSNVHFAKTKFALHAGLAFGAFHRYIYEPYKSGDFHHPFLHKLTLIKAGAAALFVKHELGLAAQDVHSSKILSKLFSPLTVAAATIGGLASSIEHGSVNGSSLDSLESKFSSIGSTASSKGQAVQDQLPSASQLTGG